MFTPFNSLSRLGFDHNCGRYVSEWDPLCKQTRTSKSILNFCTISSTTPAAWLYDEVGHSFFATVMVGISGLSEMCQLQNQIAMKFDSDSHDCFKMNCIYNFIFDYFNTLLHTTYWNIVYL